MKKATSIILTLTLLLALTTMIPQTEATATEQSALAAYKEYLGRTHRFQGMTQTYTWGASNIRYAELLDIDNNGIPELLLVFNLPGFRPTTPAHDEYGFVIIGYNGNTAVELFSRTLSQYGGSGTVYGIARGTGSRMYIVEISFESFEDDDIYYTLDRGSFTTVLRRSSYYDPIDDIYFCSVNGASVTYTQYTNAPLANLGISAQPRVLDIHTTNNVQAVLTHIDNAAAQPPIKVLLDGRELTFDVPPQMISGRTLVPMRTIFEALGATVDWNASMQTVTATKGNTVIVLMIGSTTAILNGREVTIDQPAVVINARTLVPLRFVSEALGVNVDWNGTTRTITITS